MQLKNTSKGEKTMPDGTILAVDEVKDFDEETLASWGKHPVVKAWVEDGDISMEGDFPESEEDEFADVSKIGEWSRAQLVRFLRSKKLPYKGSTETLRQAAVEAAQATE